MRSFNDLLREASAIQGHLCGDQILGVRMSMIGCREVNVHEPWECKRLVVHVEMDQMNRCAIDAIQALTGCSLGKRTLKFLDYGKMAATFFNLETQKAVRIAVKDEGRSLVAFHRDQALSQHETEVEGYALLSEECLFSIQQTKMQLPDEEVSEAKVSHVFCEQCGEAVSCGHEIKVNGRILCIPCARGSHLSQSGRQAALKSRAAGILLVVGRKNVGKTTLIERLVPELSVRGYRVGTVKHHHSSSPMMVDHEGKDSWRHRKAGARSVALVSPSQVAVFRDTEERIPLTDLMEYFEGVDIVLVEGFRSEPIPRIVVCETLQDNSANTAAEHQLLATICPEKREGEAPFFKTEEIKLVVDSIETKILGRLSAA